MVYLDNYLKARNERLASEHKPARVLKGDRRKHVVHQVIDILGDWRSSKFEHEGAVRSGLRSAFCLEGHKWSIADIEADALVQEGLRRIGAKRPDWVEGQRDFADGFLHCAWCGTDLPDEEVNGGRKGRFCSTVCAHAAYENRVTEERFHLSSTGRAAYRIIRREKLPAQECKQCGATFRPFNWQKRGQIFCSTACSQAWHTRLPDRECKTCGTIFHPSIASATFCSWACYTNQPYQVRSCPSCSGAVPKGSRSSPYCCNECFNRERRGQRAVARAARARENICGWCNETFISKAGTSKFCSANCRALANYHAKKKKSAQVIPLPIFTLEIFDGWFTRAA